MFRKASSQPKSDDSTRKRVLRKASESDVRSRENSESSTTTGEESEIIAVGSVFYGLSSASGEPGSAKMAGIFTRPRMQYLSEISADNAAFDSFQPLKYSSRPTIEDIACGESSIIVIEEGNVRVQAPPGDAVLVVPVIELPLGVCGGATHALAWTSEGLYTWGDSDASQLGRPKGSKPLIEMSAKVDMAASKAKFTILLLKDGTVHVFGLFGEVETPVPTPISMNRPVISVATGGSHCVVVTNDGCLFGWGNNSNAELGDIGTLSVKCPFPTQLALGVASPARSVSCGLKHTAVLTWAGHICTMGSNEYGQLGHELTIMTQHTVSLPHGMHASYVDCGDFSTTVLDAWGRVWVFGRLRGAKFTEHMYKPRLLADQHDRFCTKVASGAGHLVSFCSKKSIKNFRTVQQWCSSTDHEVADKVFQRIPAVERLHLQNGTHTGFLKSLTLPSACISHSEAVFIQDSSILTLISDPIQIEAQQDGCVLTMHPSNPKDSFWKSFRLAGVDLIPLDKSRPTTLYVQLLSMPDAPHLSGLLTTGLELHFERQGHSQETRIALQLSVHAGSQASQVSPSMRTLLGSASWLREDLSHQFVELLANPEHGGPVALIKKLALLESKREEDAHEEMFFWGMARLGADGGWLQRLFSELVQVELVEKILKGGDATATAFRSKSPLTGLFRGVTRLFSSGKFVRQVREGLSEEGLDVMELILTHLVSAPPLMVISVLHVLNEELVKCEMPHPERLVAFFFFTRYLVPQMIATAPSEDRGLIMSYAKELGSLVAGDSISGIMEKILSIPSLPEGQDGPFTPRSNRDLIRSRIQKALGLQHERQSRAGMLCFLEAAATVDLGSHISHLWHCAVTRPHMLAIEKKKGSRVSNSSSRPTSRKSSLARSLSGAGTPPSSVDRGPLDLRDILSSQEPSDSW